ncbi:hypothetical protein AB0B50_27890 [Streptomyces sp. NPDC041068]|uniref:hypothetical protein n=1 Tax=Streptomyces sp. NPDC041068 TaxID=3155130 RepID=UPI0034050857
MYALIVLVPFVLLATVMGLSWWEDRILPPSDPADASFIAPTTSSDPRPAPDPTPLKTR